MLDIMPEKKLSIDNTKKNPNIIKNNIQDRRKINKYQIKYRVIGIKSILTPLQEIKTFK